MRGSEWHRARMKAREFSSASADAGVQSPHCIPDVLTPQRMGRVAQPGQHVVPWVKVGNATLA